MLYTRACNVTRRPVSCITRPRRGEIGSSQERGDRWLFSGQRTDGWLVFSTTRGGCVTRTSDANLARVRKRKGARTRLASWRGGAREKGGMRFLRLTSPSLPPSLFSHQISSSTEFRLCESKSLRERCLRLDVSIQLLSSSMDQLDGGEGRGGLHLRDPNPLYTPRKSCGGLNDLSSLERERRLRNDFIGSLTGSIATPVAYRNEDL